MPMKYMLKNLCMAAAAAAILFMTPETAHSIPARKGTFALQQPDGTSFMANLKGDEYMRILTTAGGNSIRQAEDGYYYYSYYDSEGNHIATEWKVGDSSAPADVLARSMSIPYELLRQKAGERRRTTDEIEAARPNLMRRLSARRLPGTKTSGATERKHGIVILAEFSDEAFTFTRNDFVNMLTQEGYSYNGASGSASDYFNDQFNGIYEFSFDVSEIVTLTHTYSYYGANDSDDQDSRPAEMVKEACELADAEIDFSLYDDDGDGEVDNVFVFFAGGDEAEGAGANRIWSHAWYVRDGAGLRVTLDGKVINRYACSSELSLQPDYRTYDMAGIGTFCHEFSHTLGLMDYYDTDYEGSGGEAKGMWTSTALMDGGNYNDNGNTPPNYNAVDRETTGIADIETITEEGTYTLEPIHESGKCYRIDSDTEDEYFLLECRSNEGWDAHIGGSGLLIYHIDKSQNSAGWSETYGKTFKAAERWTYNEINCRPSHQCGYIVAARPNAVDVSQVFWPNGDYNSFTPASDPAFTFWSGENSGMAITGITKNGDNITFTISAVTGVPPTATVDSQEIYQDAAIISWSAILTDADEISYATLQRNGTEVQSAEVQPYETGKYCVTFEELSPSTAYTAEIYFKEGEIDGKKTEIKFTTSAARKMNYPFIYLKYVEKNSDGTFPAGTGFPLRLFNAMDAEGIVWKYDGEEISTGLNGYFTPERSGTMTAEIIYSDGSKDMVSKEIELK